MLIFRPQAFMDALEARLVAALLEKDERFDKLRFAVEEFLGPDQHGELYSRRKLRGALRAAQRED